MPYIVLGFVVLVIALAVAVVALIRQPRNYESWLVTIYIYLGAGIVFSIAGHVLFWRTN